MNIQIDIPSNVYGNCGFFIPPAIGAWLKHHSLTSSYCGWSGNGNTTNVTSHFIVEGATEEDALALKFHFPYCKIHSLALN